MSATSSSSASALASSSSSASLSSVPLSLHAPYDTRGQRAATSVLSATSLRRSWLWLAVAVALSLLTGGLFALALLWSVRLRCWFRTRTSPQLADSVLVRDTFDRYVHAPVHVDAHTGVRYFEHEGLRHALDAATGDFAAPLAQGVGELTVADVLQAVARVKASAKQLELLQGEELHAETTWTTQCGRNELRVPMGSLLWAVVHELLGPVHVYQYGCVIVWLLHDYAVFACIILLLIWSSSAYDLWQRRRNRARIQQLAAYSVPVRAYTRGAQGWREGVPSTELRVGDVIQIGSEDLAQPRGARGERVHWQVPADLAVVQGALSVDEASLTGESLPVLKTAPESSAASWTKKFVVDAEKRSVLLSGTRLLSLAHDRATLVVVRAGFQTNQGALVRSILHAAPASYAYEREARVFVLILAAVSALCFLLALWLWGAFRATRFEPALLLFALETIAILVPPMLPLVFHVGLLLSARALQDVHVYTTSPQRIPGAGTVRSFCFDKTGTLTTSELDVIGALPVRVGGVGARVEFGRLQALASLDGDLARSLAVCHELSVLPSDVHVHDTHEARYSGPAVDVKLFAALKGWRYDEATLTRPPRVTHVSSGATLELVRRCEFEHALQRMSAVARDEGGRVLVACKGSVEALTPLCDPASLPHDLAAVARDYARNGCYVLALASAQGSAASTAAPRSVLESKLTLRALLLLRNELKPDSRAAIHALKQGRIRPLMLTGDNIYTALYIGRAVGMLPARASTWIGDVESGRVVFRALQDSNAHVELSDRARLSELMQMGAEFALTSVAFESVRAQAFGLAAPSSLPSLGAPSASLSLSHDSSALLRTRSAGSSVGDAELRHFLTERVRIFARMKPLQKEQVVADLMDAGHVTGMCGDGANDCAALSKAHCGVALSEAEASLVAAFTARSLSCAAAVDLVREGRSALDNAFAAFRFTIFYGVVQVTQALLAYCYGSDLAQGMYILIDFVFFAPVMFFIVKSRAVERLRGNPPASNVFGPTTLASILGSIMAALLAFFAALFVLERQPWYRRSRQVGVRAVFATPETTTLFLVGAFLYAGAGLALGWGGRWRQRVWRNPGLSLTTLLVLACALVLVCLDDSWDVGVRALLQMRTLPLNFRLVLLLIGAVGFVDLLLWELLIVSGPVANWLRRVTNTGRRPQLADEDSDVHVDAALSSGEVGEALDRSALGDTSVALEEQDADEDEEDALAVSLDAV